VFQIISLPAFVNPTTVIIDTTAIAAGYTMPILNIAEVFFFYQGKQVDSAVCEGR
jgi:hypothetical protein